MNERINGWFTEICEMWPGRALAIEIENKLYSKRSAYQQIDLYETKTVGKMLVLDGIIQFTEDDEFAYQEMLTHLAMFAHPKPEKVLVIGGGDGGVLREIGRHSMVKEIDICEIDEEVIKVCKQFVPSMACGYNDPRVSLHIADGNKFIQERQGYYDIIIVDSTDPIGPAKALFEEPFYASMKSALNSSGIIATQAESFFMHKEVVHELLTVVNRLFPVWGYSYMLVPTYPGGNLGVCLASLGPEVKQPARLPDAFLQSKLKYYTPQIHEASFILPAFGERMISEIQGQ